MISDQLNIQLLQNIIAAEFIMDKFRIDMPNV
jgi:hypothetical protein